MVIEMCLEGLRAVLPVSQLLRREILLQEKPIGRNLLAVLICIDAIMRVDWR